MILLKLGASLRKRYFRLSAIMTSNFITGAEELFVNPDLSERYKTFRPSPPSEVIEKIVTFLKLKLYAIFRPSTPTNLLLALINYMKLKLEPPYNQAVDVGCGSGQSTSLLSPYFIKVLGIDVSEAQLNQARNKEKNSNVYYEIGSSDSIPCNNTSVELVSASQAAHWFNLPTFFKEVDRVLVPGGVVALYCYSFPRPFGQDYSEEILQHMRHVYNVETAGYWHENRKIVDNQYQSIELPYTDHIRETFTCDGNRWSVANYVGYIQTWSGYQAVLQEKPGKAEEIINTFKEKLLKSLGDSASLDEPVIAILWKYTLLMGRKPL